MQFWSLFGYKSAWLAQVSTWTNFSGMIRLVTGYTRLLRGIYWVNRFREGIK